MPSVTQPLLQTNFHLPGYGFVELLYQGPQVAVYRAVEAATRCSVVIKILVQQYPNLNQLAQFRNHYAIAKNLSVPGVVRTLSLELWGNGYALVMEDFGGTTLEQYTQKQPLSVPDVLDITIQLTSILHKLHQQQIIHKDIKPSNILIHPDSKQIKLIDFGLASLLPKETQAIQSPRQLEGTLAYLAPEQTGRMNRAIDYRADLYALGVLLYQLATGQVPFTSQDPMDLIHCHLAQQPAAVNQINPDIPAMIAAIIAKLMAKNAENRYQSALGLKHDLEQCLAQWREKNTVLEFSLGQRDLSDRFLIPETLYGREAAVQTLLHAFEQVSHGASKLILVAGVSGIGKTAIVNEVHKPITRQKGFFIKGKFDQFNRNLPFSAFVQAFRQLMGQLLGESDATLAIWKAKILGAVGESGQVLIAVIPELERIIGEQPEVPELFGSAAQNRFNLLFGQFIRVFTTAEHPLVIFLDDLQWVDSASLSLLKLLMQDDSGYLLVLGAYRDNEVFPAHPLLLALHDLRQQSVTPDTLMLAPLQAEDISQLVADSLHCAVEIALPLSQLVYQKTQGNPFFATQFLQGLYEDGWIAFNSDAGYWQCDLTPVRQLALTDDVVEFMVGRLQKLPEETQSVLKLAACMGNQFDLNTLAIVCEQSRDEVAANLWRSLQIGLVIPETETYKFFQGTACDLDPLETINVGYHFLHDRVQQAAYVLIPEDQRNTVHLTIGRLLLQNASKSQIEENLLEIVNQLNIGASLIQTQSECSQLAQLNLFAGLKAKATTAYDSAANYFTQGYQLLSDDCWDINYSQALALAEGAAEATYLKGDFNQLDYWTSLTLSQVNDLLDTIRIQTIKIQALTAQNKLKEAILTSLNVLSELNTGELNTGELNTGELNTGELKSGELKSGELKSGELRSDLAIESEVPDLDQAIQVVQDHLNNRDIETLVDLPEMTDPYQLAAMKILSTAFGPAYVGAPNLLPQLVIKQVEISLKYGNTELSAYAYVMYGLILCGTIGDIESGYQFGLLADRLLEIFDARNVECRVLNIFNAFIRHWQDPLKETLSALEKGYQVGLETGEIEFVGYCVLNYGINAVWSGAELSATEKKLSDYAKLTDWFNQQTTHTYLKIYWQVVLILLARDQSNGLEGEVYQATKMLPLHQQTGDAYALATCFLAKLFIHYLFGDFTQAIAAADAGQTHIDALVGNAAVPIFPFYDSLARLALWDNRLEPSGQASTVEKIRANQEKMRHWATHAPVNYLAKFNLVEAEYQHRVLGHKSEAIDLYDRAIAGAKEHGYIQEEALANELAARFYLNWGKEKVAAGYMQDAYYCYGRWGAKAKTEDLEQRYPDLLRPILQEAKSPNLLETLARISAPQLSSYSSPVSSESSRNPLDLAAIWRATQVLSESIQIDELLPQLVQLMLKNSGADKLAIALPGHKDDSWDVCAIATPETTLLSSTPLTEQSGLPIQLIQYVKNTQEAIAINNLETKLPIVDPYLREQQPCSVLCLPILHQNNLSGLLYLQNQAVSGIFTRDRILVLNFICTQAAISLENARLFKASQQFAIELQTKNSFLNAQQESSLDGMLVVDANRQIIGHNQRFVSIWNIPKQVLETRNEQQIIDFVLPQLENQTEFLARVEYLYNYPEESSFDEILLKDQRVLERYSSPVTLASGEYRGRIWYFRDISDRKQSERLLTDYNHELEQQVEARTQALQKSEAALLKAQQVAHVGNWEFDLASQTVTWSPELFRLHGLEPAATAPSYPEYLDMLPAESRQRVQQAIERAITAGIPYAIEFSRFQADGSIRYHECRAEVVKDAQGQVIRLLGTNIDITDRKEAELALQNLVEGTAALTGPDFFPALVEHIATALRASHAFVTEAVDGGSRLRFLAAWADGEHLPNDTVDAAGTTCLLALEAGSYHCERDVIACFPENPRLAPMGVESYMGVALKDRAGQSIGTLCIFARQPIIDPEHSEQILRVFGARAAAEMERLQAQTALEQLNQELEQRVEERTTALRDQELRYQTLVESASDLIGLIDLDGNVLEVNSIHTELLGYTQVELTSMNIAQLNRPEDIQIIEAQKERFARGEITSFSFDLDFICKDGSILPTNIIITPVEVGGRALLMGMARDIRDRKRTEAALQLSEARAQATFTQAAVGFVELDVTTKKIARANRCFCEMMGYTFTELAEITVGDITHPDDRAVSLEAILKLHHGDVNSFNLEKRYIRKDGTVFWAATTCYMIKPEGGEALYSVALIQDISDRKAAEDQLRASEQRYATLAAAAPVGIFRTDAIGSCLYVSEAWCEMAGITPEAAAGEGWIQALHPDDRDKVTAEWYQSVQDNRPAQIECRFQRPDGTVCWVYEQAIALRNPAGELIGCIGTITDITDRKAAEKALALKQNHLEALLNNIPHIAWIKDIQNRFIAANQPFAEACGTPVEELIGKTDYDIWPDDLAQAYRNDDVQVLQSGQRKIVEEQVALADGTLGWLETTKTPFQDNEGRFVGTVGIAADITERKQAEIELQAVTKRLTLALQSGDLGYWQWLIATNDVFWDDRLYELHGIPQDELNYSIFRATVHPDDILLLEELVQQAIADEPHENELGRSVPYELIYRAVCPDGETNYIKAYGTVLRDEDGSATGMLGVSFNVTQIKRAEGQLALSNQQLQRASQMKDEFLATMSHELRTPLNAVLGMAECLQEEIFGAINPQQLDALNQIEQSGRHLLNLINDILDLSKITAGKVELSLTPTEIGPLCYACLSLIQRQAQAKRLQIQTTIPANLPPIIMDPQRIRQVLINLLSNAVKFTPEGGQITLFVEPDPIPDPTGACSQGFLRVTVSDTGIGIAPENIDKLFQPFVQIDSALNRQYGGTGLGLALVKQLVVLHSGTVTVNSEVEVGSSFMVDLPWTAPITPQPRISPVIEEEPETQSADAPVILLVEDDVANLKTISSYLRARKYRLAMARNGQEAIELTQLLQPKLILMDIQMPVMDGIEATKYIRQTLGLADVPIIALTALAMVGDKERCMDAGATEYLSKPLKLKRLDEVLQQYLSK